MSFSPVSPEETSETIEKHIQKLSGDRWKPVLQHTCDFGPAIFSKVSLNLIQNPNITSSHLFRADILVDTEDDELTDPDTCPEDVSNARHVLDSLGYDKDFEKHRVLVRKLIPRNPQLDRAIAQSCHLLNFTDSDGNENSLTILTPHVDRVEDLPWYHPAVRSLAYWHTWKVKDREADAKGDNESLGNGRGSVVLYYQLFEGQEEKLSSRLERTANNLLSTIYKHGQGSLTGYTKKFHHDQLISQQRIQNRYTELKAQHAKRLCDAWVEQTEPSKHVFEDLGIAAFLIELWRDMYAPADSSEPNPRNLPTFPGFVDIGCGNGVLTGILLLSGYKGQGFDARRRKTWSVLSSKAQSNLKETLFVPQPLFDLHPLDTTNRSLVDRARNVFSPRTSSLVPPSKPWHNCVFAEGTFIISNHADELTPWTPLLAYLMDSAFLAIPCCSHNLSGDRFRAPSSYNSNTADANAPNFFADSKPKKKAKSIAITIPSMEDGDDDGTAANPAFASNPVGGHAEDTSADPPSSSNAKLEDSLNAKADFNSITQPKSGDLKKLSPQARAKQPSAYASLCDWVAHLSREVGFEVEREMLRIPSTRNVGLIGRKWKPQFKAHSKEERKARVLEIVKDQGADAKAFVQRCEGVLAKSGGKDHGS